MKEHTQKQVESLGEVRPTWVLSIKEAQIAVYVLCLIFNISMSERRKFEENAYRANKRWWVSETQSRPCSWLVLYKQKEMEDSPTKCKWRLRICDYKVFLVWVPLKPIDIVLYILYRTCSLSLSLAAVNFSPVRWSDLYANS